MKAIRGLYMAVVYVLGIPVLMIMASIGFVWMVLRHHYGLDEVKELIGAGFEGFKCGHRINMHFVKYGNKPIDLNELEL